MVPDLPAPAEKFQMPKGLASDERYQWQRHVGFIRKLKLESCVDAGSLLLLVRAYVRTMRADKIIEQEGLTYATTTPSGDTMIRPRPEVAISAEASRRYMSLSQQFGMTPAARARFQAPGSGRLGAADFPEELGGQTKRSG